MHKILFSIFGLNISSYSFFTVLALLIVLIGTYIFGRSRGFERKPLVFILLATSVSAFVGARLMHLATNFSLYERQPWRLFSLDFVGFAIYGGGLTAILTALVMLKFFKQNIWNFGDTIAPFLGLGVVSMRIGCFLNGCCFGKETSVPWGVTFPYFSYAHNYQISKNIEHMFFVSPVHATQLYELAYALLGTLLATFILKKKMSDGLAILVFGLVYTIGRFINYFLRVPPTTFEAPFYFYPVLYGGMVFLILGLIWKRVNPKVDIKI